MRSVRFKRLYDILFSAAGLLVLSPVLLVVAVVIKLTDRGPVFYRQQRVGQQGRLFWIWKFRSMRTGADKEGPCVTQQGDARITPIGRWLRQWKLDELPQLWNVLRGDMSLVGPRPEVLKYVEHYTPAQRVILELKPGITDLATLEYIDEESVLGGVVDLDAFYIREVMPRKIELNLIHARRANLWEDTKIILRTLLPLMSGRHRRMRPSEPSPVASKS